MSVGLEQIDLLRKRANVGYEEAKQALEQTNGDLVEALIILEKGQKIREERATEGSHVIDQGVSTLKKWIKKGNESRLLIVKQDRQVINLPMTLAAIGTIAAPHITLFGLPLALVTNHRIKIIKDNGQEAEINQMINKVSDKVQSFTKEQEV